MQEMVRPISLATISAVAAATMLFANLEPWQTAIAEPSDDEDTPTSADIAMSAGTAAGLVAACSVDTTPIGSAFKEFLIQANLPSASRQSLVEKFKASEVAALRALANGTPGSCAGATGLMRDTVHNLTRPAS